MNWREFVESGSKTGKLATVRKSGRPHVAPVAIAFDGDDIIFITAKTSVKGMALMRGGVACMAFDEEHLPFPFVIVEGRISTSEDLEELRRVAPAIPLRYGGPDAVDAFVERNVVPGQLLVRITPERVIQRLDGNPRETIVLDGSS